MHDAGGNTFDKQGHHQSLIEVLGFSEPEVRSMLGYFLEISSGDYTKGM